MINSGNIISYVIQMIILLVLKAMHKLKYGLIRILQIITVLRIEIRDVVFRRYVIV
jgi:hypothetical protein